MTPRPAFTGINHICVVTGDLDRAVRIWADRYGIGPWTVFRYDRASMSARIAGEPREFEIRAALCVLANARLEIIEPIDGHSPYSESLARHGGTDHIHHVCFDATGISDAREVFGANGVPLMLEASFQGGGGTEMSATYFDTRADLGLIVELAQRPDGFSMPEPEMTYPGAAGSH